MKISILDFFTTLDKNPSHRDWLYCVAQGFREDACVTENGRELHEQLREEDATGCHSGEFIRNGHDHVVIFKKFDGV